MIVLNLWTLFITLLKKILDPGGMLGINSGNVLISRTILELRRDLACGETSLELIGKPRSLRVLIGIGHNLATFVVVRVIGVLRKETGLVAASREKDEKEWRKWRNVLKSWRML
jgi:hypothetical protein